MIRQGDRAQTNYRRSETLPPVKAIPLNPDKEEAIPRILERTGYSRDELFGVTNPLAATMEA